MNKVLLLTKDLFKIEEYQKLFSGTSIELVPISEINPNYIEVKDGMSYRQIVKNSAEAAVRKYNMPVLAEKFGIEIAGVKNLFGLNTDESVNQVPSMILEKKIFDKVHTDEEREAKYICAVAFAAPRKETIFAKEELELKVARIPKGESQLYLENIFAVKGYRTTYANLVESDRNEVSPRAKSIRKILKEIEKSFI